MSLASKLSSKGLVPVLSNDLAKKAGTDLPGIPHQYRVTRLYRQWLKLVVECPRSLLTEFNEHTQMNEQMMIIVRQKFREGAACRDPAQVAVLVHSCERSLCMFRELAADGVKRKFPEAKPRLSFLRAGFFELGRINYTQCMKEYVNTYIKRKW
jgi:hypothetical protein